MLKVDWSDFKQFIDSQRLTPFYFEHKDDYCIHATNGQMYFICCISKSPSDTTDLDDFLNNYKDYCNIYSPPVTTPTVPKNEFQLEPEGLHARRFNKIDFMGEITLSNKNGLNYSFTKTLSSDLIHEDCIWFFDADGIFTRSYIESVDNGNGTIELETEIPEGTYKISRKIVMNYTLSSENVHYLWGVFFSSSDVGKYDWAVMEIIDPDTGEEVVRYDECWASHINDMVKVMTPDGSPGIVNNFILRTDYYYADDDFTGPVLKADYIITRKD